MKKRLQEAAAGTMGLWALGLTAVTVFAAAVGIQGLIRWSRAQNLKLKEGLDAVGGEDPPA